MSQATCEKTFSLEVNAPDPGCGVTWANLVWDVATFTTDGPGASATGSAAGATVVMNLRSGVGDSATGRIHGAIVSDTFACTFKLRIFLFEYVSDAIFGMAIFQNGVQRFAIQHGPPTFPSSLVIGLNEFNVPLIASVGSNIEVRANIIPPNTAMAIAAGVLIGPDPLIRLSFTISAT